MTFLALTFLFGLAVGLVVTRNLHNNPRKKFWNTQLGATGFRRANLPVGGTLGALVAVGFYLMGNPAGAVVAAALAAGMALGAIGFGIVDPVREPSSIDSRRS